MTHVVELLETNDLELAHRHRCGEALDLVTNGFDLLVRAVDFQNVSLLNIQIAHQRQRDGCLAGARSAVEQDVFKLAVANAVLQNLRRPSRHDDIIERLRTVLFNPWFFHLRDSLRECTYCTLTMVLN